MAEFSAAQDDTSSVDVDHDNLLWLKDTACDLDTNPVSEFFVEAGQTISPEIANMCRGCPVRAQCLTHAYKMRYTSGYFAGLSVSARARMSLEEALEFIARDTAKYRRTQTSRA